MQPSQQLHQELFVQPFYFFGTKYRMGPHGGAPVCYLFHIFLCTHHNVADNVPDV